jgi:hypothetical protein
VSQQHPARLLGQPGAASIFFTTKAAPDEDQNVRGGALVPGPRSRAQIALSCCVTVGVHGAVRARGRGYESSEPENPMGLPERSDSGVDRGRRSKIVVLGSRAQRPCDTTCNHVFGIVKRTDPMSPGHS